MGELDIMTTSYIQDIALALVKQYKSGDLYSIAKGEGIQIMKDPIDLPKGIVLGIAAVCKGYRSIYLQQYLNEAEKHQAIARALGIHILFLLDLQPACIAVMQNGTDEQQEDAINFAEALLKELHVSA